MSALKGVPMSISPDLLEVLARMGHGDHIVIADGNFPGENQGADYVIRADGMGVREREIAKGQDEQAGLHHQQDATQDLEFRHHRHQGPPAPRPQRECRGEPGDHQILKPDDLDDRIATAEKLGHAVHAGEHQRRDDGQQDTDPRIDGSAGDGFSGCHGRMTQSLATLSSATGCSRNLGG